MPFLRIIDPGLSTTLQDLGRHGHAAVGVSESGAADRLSLRIGNRLLANADHAAAIESTLIGATIEAAQTPIRLAITGGSVNALIETTRGRRPVPSWTAIELPPHARLVLGNIARGCRVYVTVAGGINAPLTLGSRSIHAPTGIGGRALRAGDTLPITETNQPLPGDAFSNDDRTRLLQLLRSLSSQRLRITPTPEAESNPSALAALCAQPFRVHHDSDRVGIRLQHTRQPIAFGNAEAPSQATLYGTIQITPEQPIILGPDAAPTGGYPAIGTVIAADLDALAQKRPGDTISFQCITQTQAWQRWREREALLNTLLPPTTPGPNNP